MNIMTTCMNLSGMGIMCNALSTTAPAAVGLWSGCRNREYFLAKSVLQCLVGLMSLHKNQNNNQPKSTWIMDSAENFSVSIACWAKVCQMYTLIHFRYSWDIQATLGETQRLALKVPECTWQARATFTTLSQNACGWNKFLFMHTRVVIGRWHGSYE